MSSSVAVGDAVSDAAVDVTLDAALDAAHDAEPDPTERLASLRSPPRYIVGDADRVYWTECPFMVLGRCRTGSVMAYDKRSAKSEELAKDQHEPWHITIDADHVYWTTIGDDTVWRIPKSGGKPKRLGKVRDNVHDVVVDAESLYVFDRHESPHESRVLRMKKTGSPWRVLAKNNGLSYAMDVGGDRLYWGDSWRKLWSVALTGGKATMAEDIQRMVDVVVDGDVLLVSSYPDDTAIIQRIPLSGGPAKTILTLSADEQKALGGRLLGAPNDMLLVGDMLFFRLGAGDKVGRVPKRGGKLELIPGLRDVIAFTADEAHVYVLGTGGGAPFLGRARL
jgi:hypothetical protein